MSYRSVYILLEIYLKEMTISVWSCFSLIIDLFFYEVISLIMPPVRFKHGYISLLALWRGPCIYSVMYSFYCILIWSGSAIRYSTDLILCKDPFLLTLDKHFSFCSSLKKSYLTVRLSDTLIG